MVTGRPGSGKTLFTNAFSRILGVLNSCNSDELLERKTVGRTPDVHLRGAFVMDEKMHGRGCIIDKFYYLSRPSS